MQTIFLLVLAVAFVACAQRHIVEQTATSSTGFILELAQGWQLANKNNTVQVPNLQIPSTVHMALKNAGKIGEPYFRFNDVDLRWVAQDDWSYSYTFSQEQVAALREKAANSAMYLVCEGLDTVASIFINGQFVATTNNMFRRYQFSIASLLQDDGASNGISIQIKFQSAISYAATQAQAYPYKLPTVDDPVQHGEPHRNMIRKEQCSFSWDWYEKIYG